MVATTEIFLLEGITSHAILLRQEGEKSLTIDLCLRKKICCVLAVNL